jgi:hypothetical protein
MTNIFLGISGHGYGHLSQIIPIANKLLTFIPQAKFFIHCNLPTDVIEERLNTKNFIHNKVNLDVGLVQQNPLDIDIEATYKAYQQFHATYFERVEQLCEFLVKSNIKIVIADIPYLAIEAAARASIPSVAIASLSWDKVLQRCLDDQNKEIKSFIDQIRNSHAKASLVLHPTPSMNLDSFPPGEPIPPVVLEGNKIVDLRERMGISKTDERKIVLVSLGGIKANNIPINSLINDDRFHWVINSDFISEYTHLHSTYSLKNIIYRDLISSVDAVVSKIGYGTAVEVVKYQLPFVYTCRGNFPDEPSIVRWLISNARCKQITIREWLCGEFGDHLISLMNQPAQKRVESNGDDVAAHIIYENFLSVD